MEKEQQKKKHAAIIVAVIILLLLILLLLFLFMKKEYKVTFDSNGGSEVAAVTIKENEKLEKPEDPTREGYIFGGWYHNEELYDFDLPVKQDMTLEAEWALEGVATTPVTGVKLSAESISLGINGAEALIAVVEPENATNPKVTWTSSDESIVTVDENGNIKGLKAGTAIVTVTTEDGNYTATCEVTVSKEKAKDVAVTGVKINGGKTVTVGSTIRLTATVSPSNATNKSVTWSSSNSKVATVDRYGNVKGLKAGKATITVRAEDGGFKATYTVTVKAKQTSTQNSTQNSTQKPTEKPTNTPTQTPSQSTVKVTGVKITGGKDIYVGDSITLTAAITPSNATNKKVTWSSSNSKVATVDAKGNVKGLKEGKVTITVRAEDGGFKATYTVTVKAKSTNTPSQSTVKVTGVKITGGKDIYVGDSVTLTAVITPSNATNKKVKWESKNNGIATVSDKGVVKGVKEGTAEIKVTTEDGGFTATYTITVKSKYKLLLKAVDTGLDGTVMQYTATVTRDGVAFTDFTSVIIGTHTYRFKGGNNTVKASDVKGNPSVTIKLKDGTTRTAILEK